jgi:hypothetical protein
MASDPKARTAVLSYSGGTVSGALGLLEFLFGEVQASWQPNSTSESQTGRKRYKYGTRFKSNAAAGQQVFIDLGEVGTYALRVTGTVTDFIDAILPKTGDKVKRIYTRRGSVYGPTFADL